VIDSLPLMGRYFLSKFRHFGLIIVMCRGRNKVRWRLGKETSLAPPCSNLRSFGSKCTVLKKVLMTILWLFTPPQWFGSRELCPLPPSLRRWWYAIKIAKVSENKQIFKSERHELLCHEHLQFSKTIGLPQESCTDCQQRLLAAFQVSSCSFCVPSNPAPCVFRRGPVFVLLIIKLFQQSTSYFFEVR